MSVAATRTRAPAPGVALVVATVAVSSSAILIRYANDDAATIVWLRMGIATVVLLPWVARDVRRRVMPRGTMRVSLVLASGVLLAG
ncbi:MAG: hypothetical protein QOE18_1334, partial [Chloroflexota bacterium]|nr:hypothetical protein [Chloroflexota bacterium]